MNPTTVATRPMLSEAGYARYSAEEVVPDVHQSASDLRRFVDFTRTMREDPYAPGSRRYRAYSRAVALPWDRSFSWLPTTTDQDGFEQCVYHQGEHNTEFSEAGVSSTPYRRISVPQGCSRTSSDLISTRR